MVAAQPGVAPGYQRRWTRVAGSLATPIIAILIATILASIALMIAGHNPVTAMRALVERALLRPAGIQEMLVSATPLLIAAVAVLIGVKAGLWNIGVDGQVLVGALMAAYAAHLVEGSPRVVIWSVAIVAGIVGGGLWVAVPALLRARFGTNEIVTTIMFNYVAFSLTAWLVKGPLRDQSIVAPQTPAIPRGDRLPFLGDTRVHAGILLAILVWAGLAWWLARSEAGFNLRATGENPRAAKHALIPVGIVSACALIASGAIAGLAGANDVLSTKGTFQAEWDPGYGLTAFALVFLARRSVWGLIPAALFFGLLAYGANVMPRAANIPSAFFELYEGLMLIVLAVFAWQPWRRTGS